MRSTFYNLQTAQTNYYNQGRMADFWIDLKKVPLAELDAIAALPGVTEIRPRIQFLATVDLPNVAVPLNGIVLSLPDRRQRVINDISMVNGNYFTNRRDNEVIVNDAFARKRGITPGDWIYLILNNRRQEVFVVGTAISCEYVYAVGPGAFVPDPLHFGVFYVKRSYAEEVFDFDGAANQVVGSLAPAIRDFPDQVLDHAELVLEPYGVAAKYPRHDQPSNRFLSDEIHNLGVFATFMPLIFLSVAALVLNVLISRLIEQQRTIVGTLKAIGYSNRSLFVHFLKFGFAVGLIGGLIGCVAGYLMADWLTEMYKQYFEFPELNNEFYPGSYLIAILVSLMFAVGGSLHGASLAVKLKPAEAMRPKPPAYGGRIWLERFDRFWHSLSFAWRMVIRLVLRHRLRSAVGIFAAAMGSALLTSGFMLAAALMFLVDFQYSQITRSDVDLSFSDELGIDALAEARRLPGVDAAEPMFMLGGTFYNGPHSHKAGISGITIDAQLTIPRDRGGEALPVPEVGLVLSRKLAELLYVRVGDTVTFRPSRGLRRYHEVPVMRIADDYLGISAYADIVYLSRLVGEHFVVNSVQLKVNPTPEIQQALNRELKQLPAVQAVNRRADVIENLEKNLIEVQDIFIGLLTLFAGVIFFGSILTASLIGLAERQREVATLRVLGHTEWRIGGLFLRESLLLNFVGAVLGLPLGHLLTELLAWYMDTELFRFPVITSPTIWLKTVLIAMAFAMAAHLVVQRNVNRTDWLEALERQGMTQWK